VVFTVAITATNRLRLAVDHTRRCSLLHRLLATMLGGRLALPLLTSPTVGGFGGRCSRSELYHREPRASDIAFK